MKIINAKMVVKYNVALTSEELDKITRSGILLEGLQESEAGFNILTEWEGVLSLASILEWTPPDVDKLKGEMVNAVTSDS